MQFYNLKTRSHVEVADADVRKKKMTRETKTGEQIRYAFTTNYQGTNLYKFVNEATYNSLNAPEVE